MPNLEADKVTEEKLFDVKTGDSVWEYKQYKLAAIGGQILNVPRPTPAAFSVNGLANLALEKGDMVMAARDNSNNPRFAIAPGAVLQVKEIKDFVIGIVDRIEGNRVIIRGNLVTQYGEEGWPKPGGAVTKVVGFDRSYIDQDGTEEYAKEKQKQEGGRWV